MSRKLTTPKTSGLTIVEQNVPRLTIEIGFVPAASADGAEIDLTKTAITYDIADVVEAGHATHIKRRSVTYVDWPPRVVTAIKKIMAWAETDGESAGLIDPGVSSADL